ncbi:hypothetical protein PBY51_007295 [Eleginops maclovinus]|uniref:Uncharacterized protein n=1 Tax=Eleginops maclovinus TaxID=56733 RepID=A0AAN7X4Z2_ELEMC|nr:hypothetical protein PBY51_007295 [Eleginops maclovinus]
MELGRRTPHAPQLMPERTASLPRLSSDIRRPATITDEGRVDMPPRHHLPRCRHYLLCSKHCPILHRPLLSSHLVSNKHHTSVQHMLQSDWLPLLQDIMSPFLKCLSPLRIPLWRHGLDLLQLAYHIHFCHSNSSTRSNGLRHIPLPGQVLLLPSGNLLTLRHIQILYSTNNTCLLWFPA